MSALFFEVYKNPNDHVCWDKHIEYFSKATDIAEPLKTDVIQATRFLKSELKNGFLKELGPQHPVRSMFFHKSEWELSRIVRYAHILTEVKNNADNYKKLLKKIHSPYKSRDEGIPFLEVLSWFMPSGFNLAEIEPKISGFTKEPDLKLIFPDTNEKIFFEITRLDISSDVKKKGKSYHFLSDSLRFSNPVVPFAGKVLGLIENDSDRQFVIETIVSAKKKALTEKAFLVVKNQFFEIAFADYSCEEELKKWKKEQKLSMDLLGLPLNFNDTSRILSKLSEEAKQIPKGQPGIIFINIDPMFFLFGDIWECVERVAGKIIEFNNVIGLGVYSHCLHATQESQFNEGGLFYSKKLRNNVLLRDLLFIPNTSFNIPLSENAIDLIYKSFEI